MRVKLKSAASPGRQKTTASPTAQAVLRAAEGDRVDAGIGGQRGERRVERGRGVREPGAVDVHEHAELVGGVGDRAGLLERVDGAELGRLRDRDEARLDAVLVAAVRLPAPQVVGAELAVLGGDGEQLGAGEPLGRAALVDVHVGDVGADHRLVGSGERVDRGDVGAAAVEDAEPARLGAEMLAKELLGARGPVVGAVAAGVAVVGGHEGLEHLGVSAGVVVGGEAPHAHG